MTDDTKHATPSHGDYERQDLAPSGILYFLLTLGVATILCLFGLRGLYAYLDQREKAGQPPVNPLITNVPADTRHIAPGYPQTSFPSPKLEEDERGQLNGILLNEEKTLYSYGWVDEKAGTIHIPIERAMDLIVERGLPVRPQSGAIDNAATASGANRKEPNMTAAGKKGEMQ
ncbi:MAG TPA: hypothetical protein VFF64_11020 [Candidatus Eremiobacteraceae bacterium]|nr:hypothetical protein [Candidatus Eremiobacteraceae bacterium]